VTAFGFNENDAKRIGKAVRAVERDPTKVRLGGPSADGAAPGVRLLIARHEGISWAMGATATVTVYNGLPGAVASALTMVAYNHHISFGSNTQCTSRWVALGHNGFAWHPVAPAPPCGDCFTIGGTDFKSFAGFSQTATQILGHDAGGCISWFDVKTCATN